MFALSANFGKAREDYLYLLGRNYPQRSLLKIVGDRYQLPAVERSMLFRGVVTHDGVTRRGEKKASELPRTVTLFIDGYNVLRTVGSYLSGKPVFISMDGFLRDASEIHRGKLNKKILLQSKKLLFERLSEIQPAETVIFLDAPVSKSGDLAADLNLMFTKFGIEGKAKTLLAVDQELCRLKTGIIVTSDSAIIDATTQSVYDLAHDILFWKFDPELINLREI